MERQNNDRNYSRRNRQKSRTRKKIRYGSVCVALCLLIAVAIFGAVDLLKGSGNPPHPITRLETATKVFSKRTAVRRKQFLLLLPPPVPLIQFLRML